MTGGRMHLLLACTALWVATADNSSADNSSANASNSSGSPKAPLEVKLDIQGQSGSFTVYDKSKGKASGIMIKMDALREVDASGNAVGTSGSTKHSINTFAPQDFTIEDPENVTLGNATANKIAFSSPIAGVGQISVDTYVIATGGEIGTPTEKWNVSQGDLKWNIKLSSWSWCGCKKGQVDQVGAFIDLDVTIKGKQDAKSDAAKNKTLDLGGGLSLELSDQVQVDGEWVSMPAGYPQVTVQGSSTTLTFRFPKFSDSALYDPVITGFAAVAANEGGDGGGNDGGSSDSGSGADGNITCNDANCSAQIDGSPKTHPTSLVAVSLLALVAGCFAA